MNRYFSLISLLVLSISITNLNAQFYWVGGSGDWSDYANHWATSSGGSTFHSNAPTQDDDVIFDANSFTSTGQTVSMSSTSNYCRNFDCSAIQNFPAFDMASLNTILYIYGSAVFSADANYNLTGLYFKANTIGNTITTNGANLGDNSKVVIYNNGEYSLEDNLFVNGLDVISGTFNTNNHTLNIGFAFRLSSGSAKTVNLGSSEIYCQQLFNNADNLILNSGTSHFYCSMMFADEGGFGPYDYYDLTFTGTGILRGNANFHDIDASQSAGSFLKFKAGTTITCNTFVLNADRHNPTDMYLEDEGDFATLQVASGLVEISWVVMTDIHATGGATFSVNPGIDNGNNDGWNFTAIEPLTYYWVGNSGNWSDLSHWATSSGGSSYQTELPSQFDDIYFDNNSFSNSNESVSLDVSTTIHNLDFSDIDESMNFNANTYTINLEIYGSVDISDLVNKNMNSLLLYSMNTENINVGATGSISYINFYGGGEYNIQSDISCNNFTLYEGTVNTNGFTINCLYDFRTQNYNAPTFNLGSSEIFCNNFIMQNSDNTINSGTSTIHVRGNFEGNNFSYYHLLLEDEGSIFQSNTFQTLEFAPGVISQLEAGTTQTLTNLIINGTPSSPISIASTIDGQQATLLKSTGTVNASYVSLKDNNATGGATFNANQSIDNGNNSGWNIQELQPQDFYWVGDSGNWSDAQNHWATTSGGTTFYNYPPGPLDDVYFDQNSFQNANQTVSIDQDAVYCHTLDWSQATNNPTFFGPTKTVNVYGSLLYNNNMSANVSDYNFLGENINEINSGGNAVLSNNSNFKFNSIGVWNLSNNLNISTLRLESGTLNTNDYTLDVSLATYFIGESEKTFNLGSSNYHTRMLQWEDISGDNLTINGQNSTITCSSAFSPTRYNATLNTSINLNDMNIINYNMDNASLVGDITFNTLTIEAGVTLTLSSLSTITTNNLMAEGTADNIITIHASIENSQATFYQESGAVNGTYLDLKDLAATGGAEFYANNSLNSGNVSGWIFSGTAQTITFPEINDVMEDAAPIALNASASSGLEIVYNLVAGPATLDGNILTITGPGLIQIQATQAGNIEYNPAPSVTIEFCAIPYAPIITGEILETTALLTSSAEMNNQWLLNGNEIPGAVEQTFEATQTGIYTAVIDVDGCVSEPSNEYNVEALGINELNSNLEIKICPNPVVDRVIVSFDTNVQGKYQLLDARGKLIKSSFIGLGKNKSFSLDFSDLEAGVYLLTIDVNSISSTQKIIKQ